MSHSFTIKNAKNLNWSTLSNHLNLSVLGQSDINGLWPATDLFIFEESKTARALHTSYDGNELNIRIMAASSPSDYALAIKLVRAICRTNHATVKPEDNDELMLDEFIAMYDAPWIKKHCASSLEMIFAQILKNSHQGAASLSTVHKEIDLDATFVKELLKNKQTAAKEFFNRILMLNYEIEEREHSDHLLYKDKPANSAAKISGLLDNRGTLLKDENTAIMLSGGKNDESESIYISMPDLAELIPNAIKLGANYLYVPELSDEQLVALKQAAIPKSKDISAFYFDYQDPSDDRENNPIEGELLDSLCNLPIIVFISVAIADGEIDEDEINTFKATILLNALGGSDFLKMLMINSGGTFDQRVQRIMELSPEDIMGELLQGIYHMKTMLNEVETLELKEALLYIATKVAEASEDENGNAISEEEATVIEGLESFLSHV